MDLFVVTGSLVCARVAFGLVSVGNAFGDWMLVVRWRGMHADQVGAFWGDYLKAVRVGFRGGFPRLVTFHALFSGVVYFGCLAVCIAASLSQR